MSVALGIDIGGTHTKIGLVGRDGVVSGVERIPTDARGTDATAFLQNLRQTARKVVGDATLFGVGLSTHGHIDDNRRGPILCENTPALQGIDMKGLLESEFAVPVVVNNDLTAHALAEYRFGSGEGSRRFMVMAIGTGLGVGVIVNGEALRYVEGTPGDTGRVILDPDGPPDVLGVRGSAEGLCGVRGIERMARERYGRDIPAYEVIRDAREGNDPLAVEIMAQIGRYLGHALALLSPVFIPDKIALTGGTTEAGAVLLDACRARFDELMGDYHRNLAAMAGDYYSEIEITLGRMRGETGVAGAIVELLD